MIGEIVVTLFLFALAVVITAMIFGVWLIVTILRLCARVITGVFQLLTGGYISLHEQTVRCARPGCLQSNPREARFCRRCGMSLDQSQRVKVRRAA